MATDDIDKSTGGGDRVVALLAEQDAAEAAELQHLKVHWSDAPVLIVFAALFTTVFLQFFTRYVLNDSLSWTEEAARYLLVLLSFVGIIKCQLLDSHIRLEVVDSFFPRHVRLLKLFSLTLMIVFFAVATYTLYVLGSTTSFQRMVSLPFPKYYLYILIFVALMALLAIQLRQWWRLAFGPRS